jgi:HK97 family phage major capsid protein
MSAFTHPESTMVGKAAKYLLSAKGDRLEAIQRAQLDGAPIKVESILKTAVNVGTMTDPTWGAPLADPKISAAAFINSLQTISPFARMLADGGFVRTPLNTKIFISSSAAVGSVVGERQITPVTSLAFDYQTIEPRKAIADVVISDELSRHASVSAENVINRELRKACAAAIDREMFAIFRATSPEEITATGSTSDAALTDIRELLKAVNMSATSRLYFIASVSVARRAATLYDFTYTFPAMTPQGGEILGVPVLVSDQLDDGELWLVDSAQILAEADNVVFDMSRQSSVQLNTSPDSPETASSTMINLWQHNLSCLRAIVWFGLEVPRSNAIAVLSLVEWGGGSSP